MSASIGQPEVTKFGDAVRLLWPDVGIRIEFEDFSHYSQGLWADITVANITDGVATLLHASRLNVLSVPNRNQVGMALGKRGIRVDWGVILEQACFRAIERYREGEPAYDLREVNPFERPRWFLKPYVEHSGPTVLFAPGGTGKTYLAEAMAVTASSGRNILGFLNGPPVPVLYLDWETDRYTHKERTAAICNSAQIDHPAIIHWV